MINHHSRSNRDRAKRIGRPSAVANLVNRHSVAILIACVLVFVTSCSRSGDPAKPASTSPLAWVKGADGLESAPLPTRSKPTGSTRFESLSVEQTGLDFAHNWQPPSDYKLKIYNSLPGGGICIGDCDGDDLPDVFLTQPNVGSRLYRNLGDFRFEDVTESSGLGDNQAGQGASLVDIDNDGDLDLYLCNAEEENLLFINDGNGQFTEEAAKRGLNFIGNSVMMAFADYDHDGDLDGYLVTNRRDEADLQIPKPRNNADGNIEVPEESREFFDVIVSDDGRQRLIRAAQYDHLYRNNGDGTFTDVSQEAGLVGNYWGLSAVWWDFDRDGWIDLYVSNDFYSPDQLYRNNGDGTFTDVAPTALPHTPWYSMGADVADINNDGWIDFMGSDMSGTNHYKQKASMGDMATTGWFLVHPTPRQYMRNALYLNTGTSRFVEIAQLAGVANTDWTWSLKFADLDEDGWVDLYVTNGMNRDWTNSDTRNESEAAATDEEKMKIWLKSPQRRDANLAYRNTKDLRFRQVSAAWGLGDQRVSYGCALADLDRDGDLDIVVNNAEEAASVYRNTTHRSHRVLLRLQGSANNRNGIGATVFVDTAAGRQTRQLTASQGYMSSNETLLHFGLGDETSIKQLVVEWPDGSTQSYSDLAADRFYKISDRTAVIRRAQIVASPLYQPMNELAAVHMEIPFNDYSRQPLLPNQYSQLGPGMACGDVDGDGDTDVFLSGASGQAGQLLKNNNGQLAAHTAEVFQLDADYEDMAPVLFDCDGDGDLDLYVVSGGVECEPGDPILSDRLYLNDGKGEFTRAENALPSIYESGSCACVCDFDRDGDLDLYIGGRIVPGQYPLAARSYLLRNDEGSFTDVTDVVAKGLDETGLVTSATWADVDDDGWTDLLVAHEWGPVALFRNKSGKLVDDRDNASLTHRLGWYNSIVGQDIDCDGDTDFLVGNFGWNTKYHASPAKPALLYYGDFEGTGRMRLVEAEFEDETLFPVRGKSCSTNAMPFLANKFHRFHEFAIASLDEIYTDKCLQTAHRFEANSLDSGVLLNDGTGRFEFTAFPTLAQVAPVFGIVAMEINGDGLPDVVLAQNFYGPQPETGRFDGGVGLVMIGNGDGTFQPLSPRESGVVVPNDATAACLADLDGDLQPEILFATNDGPFRAFKRTEALSQSRLIKLKGMPGNSRAIGARVLTHFDDGSRFAQTVTAGDGYLSQSSPHLKLPHWEKTVTQIEVTWPNGDVTSVDGKDVVSKQDAIILTQPVD